MQWESFAIAFLSLNDLIVFFLNITLKINPCPFIADRYIQETYTQLIDLPVSLLPHQEIGIIMLGVFFSREAIILTRWINKFLNYFLFSPQMFIWLHICTVLLVFPLNIDTPISWKFLTEHRINMTQPKDRYFRDRFSVFRYLAFDSILFFKDKNEPLILLNSTAFWCDFLLCFWSRLKAIVGSHF